MTGISPNLAAEIAELYRDGLEPGAIGEELGLDGRKVGRVIADAGGKALREGWTPKCMTAEELDTWRSGKEWVERLRGRNTTLRPCYDCTLGFAAQMRLEGRCNGRPGGVQDDDEPEEAEKGPIMATVRTQVSAPCERCFHLEVCARRAAIVELGTTPVEMPSLPKGLIFVLGVEIECDAFLPAKKSHRAPASDEPAPRRERSAAQREASIAAAARMREIRMGRIHPAPEPEEAPA